MSRAVRPYHVAGPGSVLTHGWQMQNDAEWEPLPEALPDWDYNTDLRLRIDLAVDRSALTSSTGLAPNVELRWAVSWRLLDGRVGATAHRGPVEAPGPSLIHVQLPGSQLGSSVEIRTRLVLASQLPPRPGRAHLPGSVLWERDDVVVLVGELARFPVVVTDFASNGLDTDASWALDVPPELAVPVLGGLLLLINERDQRLVRAVTTYDRAGSDLRDQLHEGVAMLLLDYAVERAEHILAENWEAGSLGSSLLLLADRSELGLTGLAELRDSRPLAYQAMLVGEARRNGTGRLIA